MLSIRNGKLFESLNVLFMPRISKLKVNNRVRQLMALNRVLYQIYLFGPSSSTLKFLKRLAVNFSQSIIAQKSKNSVLFLHFKNNVSNGIFYSLLTKVIS
jgi:hypothetical protein